MKRWLTCGLGLLLPFSLARAEEVEWRAATPRAGDVRAIVPVAAKRESRAVAISAPATATVLGQPAAPEPPRQPASGPPVGESLNPPRKAELESLPKPADKPADDSAMRTLNLVGEHPWGGEAPPVDPGRRRWFRAEYLMWFTRLMEAPALATTATPPNLGFLGGPTTQVLYGNGPIGNPFHHGGRFSAGMWLDCNQTCGIDASYFFLGRSYETFHADSTQFPVITRPIFRGNQPGPQESGQLVSFPPGQVDGGGNPIPDLQGAIDITTSTAMWGAEINARECLRCCGGWGIGRRWDVFAGFRYADLDDRLAIQENLILGQNNPFFPVNTVVQVNDRFSTHNQFYGGQVGLRGEFRSGRWFADTRLSVALGGNARTVIIEGNQFVTPPAQPTQTFRGGLLALSSNDGRRTLGAFSTLSEATINVGAAITPGFRAFLGYNFIYWTNVLRASEQIDRVIDVNLVPNFVPPGVFPPLVPPRPIVPFRSNDFWAQGLQLGVEVRW